MSNRTPEDELLISELLQALRHVTNALVKTVHITLPGYPENQMEVAPGVKISDVRSVIAKAEQAAPTP